MHRHNGFTVVELVAVIVIVGIIAAVAAPRFIGRDAFDARGAYGTLISALRYAQKTAIAQRTNVFVNINLSARTICLGYTNTCIPAVIDPATLAPYAKTLPNGVSLASTSPIIAFDGLGRPIPNAQATFQIQNAVVPTESIRTITVEAETGYVR
ncbi:MAG: prepilin-type N-terminal cleavage/methylation domain-containing protein [Methylotenera sp.]|jgi:MSHA pilin protein MshC|uniref:GspH/FimT family pseudopilin n=1 Tax=Methylotenera sp. TaxID=2051956 RepID=UPI00271A556E|nr:GspH/FimT family pseudopilin [Methylotenera sp.]MDO9150391.1 prepilin-type N-terminal cleavage/methylation domain-containing protein [Methylotenera sp.]